MKSTLAPIELKLVSVVDPWDVKLPQKLTLKLHSCGTRTANKKNKFFRENGRTDFNKKKNTL